VKKPSNGSLNIAIASTTPPAKGGGVLGIKTFRFDELGAVDLVVDAVYQGGTLGHSGDDPLQQLLGVGIGGGFRYLGSQIAAPGVRLCVLFSTLADTDWPDALYPETGRFIYFGDNRRPGHGLEDTKRKGNRLLSRVFAELHDGKRDKIPPFLVFTKVGGGRDIAFRGIAVPGAANVTETGDLVAVWRTTDGRRFQNYRATFTILDVPRLSREWIDDIRAGDFDTKHAPDAWSEWVATGRYRPLEAPKTVEFRSRAQQLPSQPRGVALLNTLVTFFKSHKDREYAFEACAANLVRIMDANVASVDLTRPWKDGGRDAVGEYRIGTPSNSIVVEFALEAKCKLPRIGNSSGVRDTARLIARLRYRQFGMFVTTSCLHEQAYQEILDDGHPVLIISGVDIIDILERAGITTEQGLVAWLAKSETGS
jgi:hypothetical protein